MENNNNNISAGIPSGNNLSIIPSNTIRFMESNNNNVSVISPGNSLETSRKIIECLEKFKFRGSIFNIGMNLSKKLEIRFDSNYYFEIRLSWDGGFKPIVYKLYRVFIQCLALNSDFFQKVVEKLGKPSVELSKGLGFIHTDHTELGLLGNSIHLHLGKTSPEEFEMFIQNIFHSGQLNNTNIAAMFKLSSQFLCSDLKNKCVGWVIDFIRDPKKQGPQQDFRFLKIASEILIELRKANEREKFKLFFKFCCDNHLKISLPNNIHLNLSETSPEELEMFTQYIFSSGQLNNTNIVAMFKLSRRFLCSDLKNECVGWVMDFIRDPKKQGPQQDFMFLQIASEILIELRKANEREKFKLFSKFCSDNHLEISEEIDPKLELSELTDITVHKNNVMVDNVMEMDRS